MFRSLYSSWVFLILGLVSVVGCAPAGPPPTANAVGTVTLSGKPLTTGEIWFVAQDKGFSANGPIDANGKYAISANLPPAEYKVFITPPRITKPPMPGDPTPVSTPLNIPDKYQTETTSGLTATIVAGPNTKDFKLE